MALMRSHGVTGEQLPLTSFFGRVPASGSSKATRQKAEDKASVASGSKRKSEESFIIKDDSSKKSRAFAGVGANGVQTPVSMTKGKGKAELLLSGPSVIDLILSPKVKKESTSPIKIIRSPVVTRRRPKPTVIQPLPTPNVSSPPKTADRRPYAHPRAAEILPPSSPLTTLTESSPPASQHTPSVPFASTADNDIIMVDNSESPVRTPRSRSKSPPDKMKRRNKDGAQVRKSSMSEFHTDGEPEDDEPTVLHISTSKAASAGHHVGLVSPTALGVGERMTSPAIDELDIHEAHERQQPTSSPPHTIIPTSQHNELSPLSMRFPLSSQPNDALPLSPSISGVVPTSQVWEQSLKLPTVLRRPLHTPSKAKPPTPKTPACTVATPSPRANEVKSPLQHTLQLSASRGAPSPLQIIPSSQKSEAEHDQALSLQERLLAAASPAIRESIRAKMPSPQRFNPEGKERAISSSQSQERGKRLFDLDDLDDLDQEGDNEIVPETQLVPTSQTQFEKDVLLEETIRLHTPSRVLSSKRLRPQSQQQENISSSRSPSPLSYPHNCHRRPPSPIFEYTSPPCVLPSSDSLHPLDDFEPSQLLFDTPRALREFKGMFEHDPSSPTLLSPITVRHSPRSPIRSAARGTQHSQIFLTPSPIAVRHRLPSPSIDEVDPTPSPSPRRVRQGRRPYSSPTKATSYMREGEDEKDDDPIPSLSSHPSSSQFDGGSTFGSGEIGTAQVVDDFLSMFGPAGESLGAESWPKDFPMELR